MKITEGKLYISVENENGKEQAWGNDKNTQNPVTSRISVLQGGSLLYQCNICLKKFKTKSNSKYHEFCQNETRPFKCEKCEKGFISKSHYEYHIRIHTGERPFSCTICEKRFNQKGKVTRHMLCHTGEKPFPCQQCLRKFANKQALEAHRLVHTGERPFTCEHCDKRYTSRTNLKKHVITHTGDRQFLCAHCGKTFGVKWTLDLHQRTHSAEKPFACDQCPKAFSVKKDLLRHQVIHTGEKRYNCFICGTAMARKDNLERHIKKIHNITKENIKNLENKTAVDTGATSSNQNQLKLSTSQPTVTSSEKTFVPAYIFHQDSPEKLHKNKNKKQKRVAKDKKRLRISKPPTGVVLKSIENRKFKHQKLEHTSTRITKCRISKVLSETSIEEFVPDPIMEVEIATSPSSDSELPAALKNDCPPTPIKMEILPPPPTSPVDVKILSHLTSADEFEEFRQFLPNNSVKFDLPSVASPTSKPNTQESSQASSVLGMDGSNFHVDITEASEAEDSEEDMENFGKIFLAAPYTFLEPPSPPAAENFELESSAELLDLTHLSSVEPEGWRLPSPARIEHLELLTTAETETILFWDAN